MANVLNLDKQDISGVNQGRELQINLVLQKHTKPA